MAEEKFENAFETIDKLTGKKVLYIMADKNCEKYAHKLQTLISAKNNVKCCIYTKSVYRDNMARVSSDNIILFIGDNNISKPALPNVKNHAKEEYGLFFGWYGKRAKISRSPKFVGYQKQTEFIEYYNQLCADFEKKIVIYGISDLFVDVAVVGAAGLLGLGIKKFLKRFIDKDLQYNACIMEFFNQGLDEFLESACQ